MQDESSSLGIEEEKHSVRTAMRRRLAAFDLSERRAASECIVASLLKLPAWKSARCVLLFAPMAVEPDVDLLWLGDRLAGKRCVYPSVAGKSLQLYCVNSLDELRTGPPWNLREPLPDPVNRVPLAEVDLLLVPGLAFDERGGRLGRGGGYYDRLLATRANGHPAAVGLGFGFQRLDRLRLSSHDVLLNAVVFS